MTALFKTGKFTLSSGLKSFWKIDCDALTVADLDTLAGLVAQRYAFSNVYSVPTGGDRFAEALRHKAYGKGRLTLLVDDVLTTGRSMARRRDELLEDDPHLARAHIQGIVIFARGKCPGWIDPMFEVGEEWR